MTKKVYTLEEYKNWPDNVRAIKCGTSRQKAGDGNQKAVITVANEFTTTTTTVAAAAPTTTTPNIVLECFVVSLDYTYHNLNQYTCRKPGGDKHISSHM
jgi:hypothetical protein